MNLRSLLTNQEENLRSLLTNTPTPVLATGGVLAFLIVIFLLVFLAPGFLHWFRLRGIQRRIAAYFGPT